MHLAKRIALILTVVTLLFTFISCGKKPDSKNVSASPSTPEIYYNGVYGIQVTVPQGWQVASVNATNMTATPDASNDAAKLEIAPYDDSGSGMQMIELWNREDSADHEHASMMVYVEFYEGIDQASYLDAFEEAYAGDFDGYYSTFESSKSVDLAGKTYTCIKYSTTLPDSDDIYYEEYYVRQISEGEFLIVSTTSWADNEISQQDATVILTSFSISK